MVVFVLVVEKLSKLKLIRFILKVSKRKNDEERSEKSRWQWTLIVPKYMYLFNNAEWFQGRVSVSVSGWFHAASRFTRFTAFHVSHFTQFHFQFHVHGDVILFYFIIINQNIILTSTS